MINLQSSQIISLDTNIFICALNKKDPRYEQAQELIEEIKKRGIRVFISVLVLEEFFIRVYKQGREKETSFILDFITLGGLASILDIDRGKALMAAKLRAEYPSIRTPDAIHLATAKASGAELFITTDKRIPRKIDKLKVIVLN